MALLNLSPPPFKSKVLNGLMLLSEPWTKFILRLFERVKILQTEVLIFDVSRDEATNLSTGTGKFALTMPFAFVVSEIRATVTTAPVGSTIIVDANEDGATILSTKVSIDAGEKTSNTAATPAVLSDSELAENAELTIDIDQVGSSTPGTGLKLFLFGVRR